MSFSSKGKFLSIGDYGGRCIIFEKVMNDNKQNYEYYTEF